jgi:hypothetical protein
VSVVVEKNVPSLHERLSQRRDRPDDQPLERPVPLKWSWVERIPLKWMEITFMILLAVSISLCSVLVHFLSGQLFAARYLMIEAIIGNFSSLSQVDRLEKIGIWRYDSYLAWIVVSLAMMFIPIITVPVELTEGCQSCSLCSYLRYTSNAVVLLGWRSERVFHPQNLYRSSPAASSHIRYLVV